ncbi:MAG: hypothetical protein KC646_11575 [Candidatus Cloacimonetes bacterium]|nr:hypothetical protein [Candidatus Cloacimonadota bacterium]
MKVKYDGKEFEIAQPNGKCCEADCPGCELFKYKKSQDKPMLSSRSNYYQSLSKPKD